MRSKLLLEALDVNLRAQLAVRQSHCVLRPIIMPQIVTLHNLAHLTREIEAYVQGKPATLAQTAAATRAAILGWLLEQILIDSKFRLVSELSLTLKVDIYQ